MKWNGEKKFNWSQRYLRNTQNLTNKIQLTVQSSDFLTNMYLQSRDAARKWIKIYICQGHGEFYPAKDPSTQWCDLPISSPQGVGQAPVENSRGS